MRLVRFTYRGETAWGVECEGHVFALEGDLFGAFSRGREVAPLNEVRLLAPWAGGKIIAVALNYKGVADRALTEDYEPLIFLKSKNTVISHGDEIRYNQGLFDEAWIEVELAFMIGKRAMNVPAHEGGDYILGYTIANDVTATNVLGRDHHLARSKSLDTFCPMGPALVTDFDSRHVLLESRVNGRTVQRGSTDERFFDDGACVSVISRALTLEPGDMVLTGTPTGTGPGSSGVIRPGDEIELEVSGIGILANRVVAR